MKNRTKIEIYGEFHPHVEDDVRGLEFTFTCEFMPVRVEGTLRGMPFVFKARDGRYQFAISEDENIAPGEMTDAHSGFYIVVEYTDADVMPLPVAEKIIESLADQYLKESGK